MTENFYVYSNAIRRLARHHNMTGVEVAERFGDQLVHIQCNTVTVESVEACLNDTP